MAKGSARTKKKLLKTNSRKQPTANRKYKDTAFRKLFHQKKELLELYNALNDSNYTKEEDLEIVTLEESSLFISMRNDLAFILDFRLHLYEHQSTPSPNMPLRDLFYVAQEYWELVNQKSLFSEKPIKIPAPRFVVFYNGMDKQPERQILKLSDLYIPEETEPMLELQVLVLNINEGHNTWLKEKCRPLYEYMIYTDRVRYYRHEKGLELIDAIKVAVEECIKEGILVDFLSKEKEEAIMFTVFEHSEEEEWRKFRQAERELGYEKGREQGIAESRDLFLHNLMMNEGMTEEAARVALGLKQ